MINVATDFSKYPGGRFTTDGKFSGQRFREEYLLPALNEGGQVTVNMDGTLGYGSSFLEEAFGGLVRAFGKDAETLQQRLTIQTSNDSLRATVLEYMREAQSGRRHS